MLGYVSIAIMKVRNLGIYVFWEVSHFCSSFLRTIIRMDKH